MIDDPVRLFEDSGSELLRVLLSAARDERPHRAALQRTLTAVAAGAVATGVSASGASAAAGTVSLGSVKGAASAVPLLVAKWLGVGLLSGLAGASVAYRASVALAPAPKVEASHTAAAAPLPSAPRAPTRAPVMQEPAEIPAPPALAPASTPPLAASAPALELADRGPPLAAEVAALDGARQALAAGDSAHALALLSQYETRFPEARMLPEALFLRLEALTRSGDQASAEAVARRILSAYPSSPHAARARAVLGLDK